jgi:MFS transporter, DHA1 family, tetracycline resistance protein
LYAQRFEANEWQIGLLLASFSFMQFLTSPILGALSDRFGRRPVLLCSLAGSMIGYLLMANAGSLAVLFIARIIAGIAGASVGTVSAYIADITPPEKRSRRLGLIGAAFGVGFVLGPAIGGLLSLINVVAPFWFAAGLSLLNAIGVLFMLPEPQHAEFAKSGVDSAVTVEGREWRLPLLVVTYFVSIAAFAIVTMIYPQVSQRRFELNQSQISYIFVLLGLVGAFIQGGLVGRLAKRFGDAKLAVIGLAVMAGTMAIMPFATSVSLLLLFTVGLAVGNSLAQPTLNALASKVTSAASQGRVLGTVQSAGSLGRVVGPAIGGLMLAADRTRPALQYGNTPFVAGGLVMGLAFLLSLALLRTEPQPGNAAVAESRS